MATVTTTITRPRMRSSLNSYADFQASGGQDGDVAMMHGYSSVGDGAAGWFWWEHGVTTGHNGGTIIVTGQGRWVREYSGDVHAAWFGALPGLGSLLPQDEAIQAAIDFCGQTGGTLVLAKGIYCIANSLRVGDAGSYVEGLTIRGEARNYASDGTQLAWTGDVDGGPILLGRNAAAVTIQNISFDGNGRAAYGIQIRHVEGDAVIPSNWHFSGGRSMNAKVANVLIGAVEGGDSYGDCSCATFDAGWFFQASSSGVTTVAHVRIRAQNTFGVQFTGVRWSSNGTGYPERGLSLQAGAAVVIGGTCESQSDTFLHFDGAAGIPLPSAVVTGLESQTGGRLLRTDTASSGAAAAQRPTVLTGVFHSDIIGPVNPTSIYWDIASHGPLTLAGVRVAGNIEIANENAIVFSKGTYFDDVAGNFTGVGAGRVCGDWMRSTFYFRRFPDLITYASNALALADGLIEGDLYKTAAGAVMVVV